MSNTRRALPQMQLNRSDVIRTALAILDDYGLADLTMRRLAGALHVQPGALYWHFPNKQTLLGGVADRVLAPLDDPVRAVEWAQQLTELAHRLRDALLSHRDGAELVSATYASRLTTSKVREKMAVALIRGGMARPDAELGAYSLLHYVLGHTVDEQSRMQLDSAGALPPESSPLYEAPDATARFDFGLQLFVSGARSRLGAQAR